MPASTASIGSKLLPSPALRRFAWGVVAYFIAVILWGTMVRATGSGDGCGDHWPLCNGTVMQHSPSMDTIIEFTHRITSGILFFSAVGLLVWTFIGTVRGHLARWTASITVGLVLVKLGYTAQSQSPMRPPFLALHLTTTLLLLAAITLTAHLLSRTEGYLKGSVRVVGPFGAVTAVIVVMIVGVTGSLAALGDTLFPASSLSRALAQDFSTGSEWLVRWRWTHPTFAVLASIFLVWILLRARRSNAFGDNRKLTTLVLVLLGVVCALGALDVALLAPVWIQVVHLLAADTLWVTLVVLTARLTLLPRSLTANP
jgi:cytochrome c oxidase assembly protein subunit 15